MCTFKTYAVIVTVHSPIGLLGFSYCWLKLSYGAVTLPVMQRGAAMRVFRPILITILIAVTVVLVPKPASAAGGNVIVQRHADQVATAFGDIDSNFADDLTTSHIILTLSSSDSSLGSPNLNLTLEYAHWELTSCSNGNCFYQTTGFTDTTVNQTSGFAFNFLRPLRAASLRAINLPTTTCTTGATGQQVGPCTTGTMNLNLSWTGQGDIQRSSNVNTIQVPGGFVISQAGGSTRNAAITGSLAGLQLPSTVTATLGSDRNLLVCFKTCGPFHL
jgi:hypothetical protein